MLITLCRGNRYSTYSGTLGLWGPNRKTLQYEGNLLSAGPSIVPISWIFFRNTIHVFLLLELCFRDVTTFRMTDNRGGNKKEITVTLPYLPYNSDEPPLSKGLREVIEYCRINCSLSLDVIPTHTTLCEGAQTSTHKENA